MLSGNTHESRPKLHLNRSKKSAPKQSGNRLSGHDALLNIYKKEEALVRMDLLGSTSDLPRTLVGTVRYFDKFTITLGLKVTDEKGAIIEGANEKLICFYKHAVESFSEV